MKELTYGGFNLGDVITSLSVSLVVVGTVVLIIATLGAIGAFCNRPACLDIVSFFTVSQKYNIKFFLPVEGNPNQASWKYHIFLYYL